MTSEFDPRTPVIVGCGQITVRADDEPREPVALMAEALRLAAADAGSPALLGAADSIRSVAQLSWRYRNPSLAVADLMSAAPRQLMTSRMGGNLAGVMLARAAESIRRGELEVVLLCGGEATRTMSRARSSGAKPAWTVQDPSVAEPEWCGDPRDLAGQTEVARGVVHPVHVYPLFEVALRARLGLDPTAHRHRLGRLWSAFSEVAATNPHAWIRTPSTPEEITEPSEANRMIATPYTKRLCSNNQVDQGSGLILTSAGAARRFGVPRDRWVFLHAGTEATDHWHVTNRADLHSSPALRLAGRDAFAIAGIGPQDVSHVDLYSCFPVAVQIAAIELGLVGTPEATGQGWGGIGAQVPLTVTGGMTFAGGPWNDYTSHGVATMTDVLRNDPGSMGMCTANGGYLTEHAVLLMSTSPPRSGFAHSEPQAEVDALPRVESDDEWDGPVTVESATVVHDRSGPTHALFATRTPHGARSWGSSEDGSVMDAAATIELVGRRGHRTHTGLVTLE